MTKDIQYLAQDLAVNIKIAKRSQWIDCYVL